MNTCPDNTDSEDGFWFAAMTNPKCEMRAQAELTALGYQTFVPKLKKWVSHARVKKAVERPLLARYIFVKVDYPNQSFGAVRLVNGIECLISNNGWPVPIHRGFIEGLMVRYMKGEWDQVANEKLPLGARVRVVEGQFDNMLATITNVRGNVVNFKIVGTNKYGKLNASGVRAV